MYAERVQDAFDAHDISVGDTIRIQRGDQAYEGRLMPQTGQGDPGVVVIKLDNGYNTGIAYTDDTTVEKVADHEAADETAEALPEPDPDLPDITVLHTGGTIASRVSYETGGVTAAFSPEDLFDLYPGLFDRANIDADLVAQMYSGDMEPAHWQQIADAVTDHTDRDGIIIGHGTDTMQYTAAALSFMLDGIDIPVVLTGAQRSSDRPSSDAAENLEAAVNLDAAVRFIQKGVPGVYICMHAGMSDDAAAVHRGTRVRKMHTSRRDTFRSIDAGPAATVDVADGSVTVHVAPDSSGAFTPRTELNDSVGLLKTVPGLDTELIEQYDRYDGVVLEGTGLGHFPVNAYDEETAHHDDILAAIADLAADRPVVMTSQCLNGRVNMHVYDYGVKLLDAGVIPAGTMLPEVAYVKLMWALGQTDSTDDAEQLFQENVAGELLDREEYDGFRR